ncbi:MAG: hypothetical protein JXQ99_02875 [Hyphomicrobiaceae bacterium]
MSKPISQRPMARRTLNDVEWVAQPQIMMWTKQYRMRLCSDGHASVFRRGNESRTYRFDTHEQAFAWLRMHGDLFAPPYCRRIDRAAYGRRQAKVLGTLLRTGGCLYPLPIPDAIWE